MRKKGDSKKGKEATAQQVDCNACAHFFITWDKRFPYGCKAMGFMSSHSPSKDVFEVEGCAVPIPGGESNWGLAFG